MNKKIVSAVALTLCGIMGLTALPLSACGGKKDSLVLMMEEPSGLFNPFYATAGADMDVVGLTQISMLSTDENGDPVAGDDLATVVKDFTYNQVNNGGQTQTVYQFVIKNGLKFSDGEPLTMNDVMFNIYEYLDPVYTGSSTMYSTDIVGLTNYRTQISNDSTSEEYQEQLTTQANALAQVRMDEMILIFTEYGGQGQGGDAYYSLSEEEMRAAINEWSVTAGYQQAVATNWEQAEWNEDKYREQLLADYDYVLKTFKAELESDWIAAQESFDTTTAPYNKWADKLESEVFRFFLYEGNIEPVYAQVGGKDDETNILSFRGEEVATLYTDRESAINKVYQDTIKANLNQILSSWGTAGTVRTQYAADARGILIRNNMTDPDEMVVPNISGIVSLGHSSSAPSSVTINGVTYNVAKEHNADGTVADANTYDVLQITVNGTDPKAIYNFGFTVAPAHYYTADAEHPNGRTIDIANNQFGVEYASSDFQTETVQSLEHVEKPMGAGAFKITDKDNNDNPAGNAFWSSNVCYYKANDNFMFEVKADKLQMRYVNSADALNSLKRGEIDYAEPQYTPDNYELIRDMQKDGFEYLSSWQLGYGYIGINAGKVPNINARKAIMSAMQTSLAIEYYVAGTAEAIVWPMSMVSWAYPDNNDNNGHTYTQFSSKSSAIQKITQYSAGLSESEKDLTFTIAGASITEHPCYRVFLQAMELLNQCGWSVEVRADSQALTKLATGSLEVWAAAWGSTIDPDMYQVYHKNSNATSVYAWGYREILAAPASYPEETRIINELSVLIDEGRETMDQPTRKSIYEDAMSLVLDLAVELPVYQRRNLYVYNSKTIKGFTVVQSEDNDGLVNPYTSPTDRIWELELVR